MKKYLILAIALILSLTLTGCFGGSEEESTTPDNGSEQNDNSIGVSISDIEEASGLNLYMRDSQELLGQIMLKDHSVYLLQKQQWKMF